MSDTTASLPKTQKASSPPPIKKAYLILYNFASAAAWLVVLSRTGKLYLTHGPSAVAPGVAEWTRWTQTAAGLEVLHALFGVVRAPVLTTLMQVLSRYLLVWGVVYPFPWLAQSPFYTSMLLAWSITEVIRYYYFGLTLVGALPTGLLWLRYNTFFVLYPVGILSECALVYLAAEPLARYGELYPYISYIILAIYVPGSYILYTHMMKQRRKFMHTLGSTAPPKKSE